MTSSAKLAALAVKIYDLTTLRSYSCATQLLSKAY